MSATSVLDSSVCDVHEYFCFDLPFVFTFVVLRLGGRILDLGVLFVDLSYVFGLASRPDWILYVADLESVQNSVLVRHMFQPIISLTR